MPSRVAFVGAGSTVFMRAIIGDTLRYPALADAHFALMDISPQRLAESELVAGALIDAMQSGATVSTHSDRRSALEGADFVVVAFQIGGYEPSTVVDFEVPKTFGLRQTIADTLGVGGIMRGLRTVPHLWDICDDMRELCPNAIMLQYVNPMAINSWAISARYPDIRHVGLCHSVPYTVREIAHDLGIDHERVRYRAAGINHMAFFLELAEEMPDGKRRDLGPDLLAGYRAGRYPRQPEHNKRCPNLVRYEVMKHFGFFVTESSEHFAEYVPWFIKRDRPDLIEQFGIPLDEYPLRCVEAREDWKRQLEELHSAGADTPEQSVEYAADIMNSVVTDTPSMIYGNVPNRGLILALPDGCAVEVPCLVDANGVQPTPVHDLPPHLTALMRTNVNVQELTVAALLEESRDHVYHAAMLDPHTAAELDLNQIHDMVDRMIEAHGDWLPAWLRDGS